MSDLLLQFCRGMATGPASHGGHNGSDDARRVDGIAASMHMYAYSFVGPDNNISCSTLHRILLIPVAAHLPTV